MKSKLVSTFLCFGAVLILGVFLFYVINFSGALSTSQEKWGQFGDYFGGVLNPILSFCALLGLLFTLQSQQRESDKAEARHREQIFDTRLFQLLSLSHDAVSAIKFFHKSSPTMSAVEYSGHRAVAYALNRLQEDYLYEVERGDERLMYNALYPKFLGWKGIYWSGVASYIESMLFVLRYAIDKAGNDEAAQFALRAALAQMSADEKLLIFYVMIFTPREAVLLHGRLIEDFLSGATQDDLLIYRAALLQSAVLARITPKTNQ